MARIIASLFLILLAPTACKKEWFDEKPNSTLVVPATIKDFQALLDNTTVMNETKVFLGEISSDNLYVTYDYFRGLLVVERNAYTWAKVVEEVVSSAWGAPYQKIFYANVVLDNIDKIEADVNSLASWNNVKGSALFFRADAYFDMAQVYTKVYDKNTAMQDLGLPLRLTSNPNEKSVRATNEQTYQQVLSDLLMAKDMLPAVSTIKTRPSRAAAFALLAKTYLSMQNYSEALLYADSCLQLQPTLMDFNNLDSTKSYPIALFNEETIMFGKQANSFMTNANALVDTLLLDSYAVNDLRKAIFFRKNSAGGFSFKGSYLGAGTGSTGNAFGGYAIDEMYLTRAECYARASLLDKALADVNALLIKRYKKNTYQPFTSSSQEEVLKFILAERRKELLFRNVRWTDLRRLNKESQFAVTITRNIDGIEYTLLPDSPLYVLNIPLDVITYNPGMPQNVR